MLLLLCSRKTLWNHVVALLFQRKTHVTDQGHRQFCLVYYLFGI